MPSGRIRSCAVQTGLHCHPTWSSRQGRGRDRPVRTGMAYLTGSEITKPCRKIVTCWKLYSERIHRHEIVGMDGFSRTAFGAQLACRGLWHAGRSMTATIRLASFSRISRARFDITIWPRTHRAGLREADTVPDIPGHHDFRFRWRGGVQWGIHGGLESKRTRWS
jgi:hypothetical protein